MLTEIQDLARRLEQQLGSYERLHADELKKFQEQMATLQRLQSDELQMLRDELNQLKQEIAALQEEEARQAAAAPEPSNPQRVEMTVTRREFLTGNLRPHR